MVALMKLPLALLLALGLLAAACTSSSDSDENRSDSETTLSSGSGTTAESGGLDPDSSDQPQSDDQGETLTPGSESIVWGECVSGLECGFVEVPTDYNDSAAGTLQIAVNVFRALKPDEKIGYLLVNPGGPGASGKEIVDAAQLVFTDEILDRFDIIGFDPRGVGESEPTFACGPTGAVLDAFNTTDPPVDTPEEVAIVEQALENCVDSMGAAAGRIHSEFVARDMDEIRKALGAEQISYLGFSYGSALGLWYASLFPDQVRAMVVDGADNPLDDQSTLEIRVANEIDESREFERLLNEALLSCDSAECPIFNDGDPVGYYLDAVDKFGLVVADVSDNPTAAILGLVQPLYNEASWPSLHQALFELQENDDATIFASLARSQMLASEEGVNITGYINCLDSYSLFPELDRGIQLADEIATDAAGREELPLLFAAVLPSVNPCPFLDSIAPAPFEGVLDGGGVPIMVIGNTSDPATPFTESEEVATETMSNGYLVEVDHPSHVVYPSNDCVNGYVHGLLIGNELPADKRVSCAREEPDDDDARAELEDLCLFVIPDSGVADSEEEQAAICDKFVLIVEENYGLDVMDRANAGDAEASDDLGKAFQEAVLG